TMVPSAGGEARVGRNSELVVKIYYAGDFPDFMNSRGWSADFVRASCAREVTALRHFANSERIIPLREVVEHRLVGDGEPLQLLVLENVRGGTLADAAATRSVHDPVRYARQLLEALHEVHRAGYVHFDIKPSNIVLRAWLPPFGEGYD